MLAIFNKSIANSPEALISPSTRKRSTDVVDKFMASFDGAICMRFDEISSMAYTKERQPLFMPRSFASVDDIFCLFEGTLENLAALRQRYGLSKSTTEVLLVIEAYRALRDRAPYPADEVVRELGGRFAFVLYDNKTRTIFAAADSEGTAPFFWGTTADGCLAFSDNEQVLQEGCGRSFAPFPEGCYFSTVGGLRSYEHPLREVKAIPRVDSTGQMCGSTFQVDLDMKRASHPHARGIRHY
jgi:asparagine synthetase B (glutamine-hydrolysing)